MSVYIRVELQRQIRNRFDECCAYCQTAEFLTAMTFEFEHIIPLAVSGETIDQIRSPYNPHQQAVQH
jgi:hypothetical protein